MSPKGSINITGDQMIHFPGKKLECKNALAMTYFDEGYGHFN